MTKTNRTLKLRWIKLRWKLHHRMRAYRRFRLACVVYHLRRPKLSTNQVWICPSCDLLWCKSLSTGDGPPMKRVY